METSLDEGVRYYPNNFKPTALRRFAMSTAKSILEALPKDSLLALRALELGPYRFWLRLHGLNLRGALNEHIGHGEAARLLYKEVAQVILTEGQISAESLRALPNRCRQEVVESCLRLPVLCLRARAVSEACSMLSGLLAVDNPILSHVPAEKLACAMQVYARVLALTSGDGSLIQTARGPVNAVQEAITLLERSRKLVDHLKMRGEQRAAEQENLWASDKVHILPAPSMLCVRPTPSGVALDLSYCYSRMSRRKEAMQAVQWGISLSVQPPAQLLWFLGLCLAENERFHEAISVLQQCDESLGQQSLPEDILNEPPQNPIFPRSNVDIAEAYTSARADRLLNLSGPKLPVWAPLFMAGRICIEKLNDGETAIALVTR
jgi:hypothetical protein